MPLSADVLLERMKLKNQLHVWRGLAILALAGLIWGLVGSPIQDVAGTDYIARIRFEGFIAENPEINKSLKKLSENDDVKAVIVHVNSPGGTVVGGENLHDGIITISQKKPVVAVLGTLATSAAYMAICPADYIFAHNGTVTGSIGVIFQSAEVVDMAEKLGIDFTILKTSPLKGAPSPFERLTPDARDAMKNVLEDFHRVFINMVAEGRDMDVENVKALADGRVYTGQQALKNKLIDEIGDEEAAISWLETQKSLPKGLKIKDVALIPQKSPLQEALGALTNAKILDFSQFSFGGLLSVW